VTLVVELHPDDTLSTLERSPAHSKEESLHDTYFSERDDEPHDDAHTSCCLFFGVLLFAALFH